MSNVADMQGAARVEILPWSLNSNVFFVSFNSAVLVEFSLEKLKYGGKDACFRFRKGRLNKGLQVRYENLESAGSRFQ